LVNEAKIAPHIPVLTPMASVVVQTSILTRLSRNATVNSCFRPGFFPSCEKQGWGPTTAGSDCGADAEQRHSARTALPDSVRYSIRPRGRGPLDRA
jgi:hypothetical protein